MSREAEEALDRIVKEEIERDPQFVEKVEYHNYLTEKYIWILIWLMRKMINGKNNRN